MLKKIEAIIRPEKLDAVKDALEASGILGMTVTNVNGRGRQKGIALQWRAGEYRVDFLPKIKLELVVAGEECQAAINTICTAAKTGREGDGMIFVLPVENAIRVRTSDCGEECFSRQ
ncbi:MAG: P-II family nitrogen regulator [Dehalococcoidia bacterium]|jgi:nitrogen regulatory protein P-II 1|nr:P-II family nitrogen regulator [Dehalococcoidia bacterium]MDD5493465.1 P-II family nitrogen regulator [Dehalococcoidia bacterium]